MRVQGPNFLLPLPRLYIEMLDSQNTTSQGAVLLVSERATTKTLFEAVPYITGLFQPGCLVILEKGRPSLSFLLRNSFRIQANPYACNVNFQSVYLRVESYSENHSLNYQISFRNMSLPDSEYQLPESDNEIRSSLLAEFLHIIQQISPSSPKSQIY